MFEQKGIALNQFEVYQTMLDKGFTVKAIASIFSVSEELIKNFFYLCLVIGYEYLYPYFFD